MEMTLVYYALFKAHPDSEPPFDIELGTGKNSFFELNDCKHIPDGIERIKSYCKEKSLVLSPAFVLLYPIYLEVMDTDHEGTMHQIAWLIKEQADKNNWGFNRIGGYTGLTANSFVP